MDHGRVASATDPGTELASGQHEEILFPSSLINTRLSNFLGTPMSPSTPTLLVLAPLPVGREAARGDDEPEGRRGKEGGRKKKEKKKKKVAVDWPAMNQ
jgi:hypothetical protein